MKNSIIHNGKRYSCRIYSNGGLTLDQFTACLRIRRTSNGIAYYPYLAFSNLPFSPLGFAQHGESREKIDGKHLGKRIEFEELNDDCKKFITDNL